jgi:inosose dehydratase
MGSNRRKFLQHSLWSLIALGGSQVVRAHSSSTDAHKKDAFALGVAGYSFVHFNLEQSLAMMKRMDIRYLCIKDFHLPLDAQEDQIQQFHAQLAASQVKGYAVGPIYMNKSRQQIDQAFAYAKRVGVDLIIGIPKKEDLPYIAELVSLYQIRFAIHNHGPEDALYPNADVIAEALQGLDPLMGICFDMGHEMRDGKNPMEALRKHKSRIFDIHLKNVTSATADGTTCELSRGVIDIPAFVDTLREIGYSGKCSLEYEKDMKDPLAGLAESVGYFRGVTAR